MYFNNRNNQEVYGWGCSFVGCLLIFLIASLVVRGSLFFFFRYFWLILIIGIIVCVFRKFIYTNENSQNQNQSSGRTNWTRDYENRQDTGYHNVERNFEEVDEEDEEDDEFSDF